MPIDSSWNDPQWYRDAVIYEIHVRAFNDSNADGIGDFKGLTRKLDYLKDLGITAIWLLPFFPSPLRDDGYDIADYYRINKDYGTLADFKRFVKEAHQRSIRVIIELVLNHTSSDHTWFQRARKAKPGSSTRDFYVWSDTPNKYEDTRIIFKDFESSNWTWDPVAKAYFWHRFFSHQPDLNYENPRVQEAMFKVIDFWFDYGVDGLRLDAVPYLFEQEGTNCENLPLTHDYLKKLRAHVDNKYTGKMLLAEANQWPEDAVSYFGKGDECHMAFHFPLMPRLFMAVQMEDSYPIIDILSTTPPIPENCQWAMFLRNHDELTLEMVTDEERDYMNRVYGHDPKMRINFGIRRRLSPLLANNRRKIELMNIILFSFPGTPVIYYGDEIGMGDNFYLGDRNGVRTPMQWSAGKNAGFSNANPQKLYFPTIIDPQYHYEAVNVEVQEENLSSMLWWMRRVISMRKQFKCFSRGNVKFYHSNNSKVICFSRTYKDETILVTANISRFTQVATLELPGLAGRIPEEVFSRNTFPQIRKTPYVLAHGPYGHYWLLLKKKPRNGKLKKTPILKVARDWTGIFRGKNFTTLETQILPAYLHGCRWFGGKAKIIRRISILDNIRIGHACLLIISIKYKEGPDEWYCLPLAFAENEKALTLKTNYPAAVVANLQVDRTGGILFDALFDAEIQNNLLKTITEKQRFKGSYGALTGFQSKNLKTLIRKSDALTSRLFAAEQSNTSIKFGTGLFMKIYRKVEQEENPELEMVQFISNKTGYANLPSFAGAVEYRQKNTEKITIGLLQEFVDNRGDAWSYTLDILSEFFDHILAEKPDFPNETIPAVITSKAFELPSSMENLFSAGYAEMVNLLGKRTAELHLALGSSTEIPGFIPENFSVLYQRSIYQSMQSLCRRNMQLLKKTSSHLEKPLRTEAETLLTWEKKILGVMRAITYKKIDAQKIRIHGDLHLGQVLYTGKDFIFMDFEGEPARPLSERKLLYSALRDVAGMVRSFHYAGHAAILRNTHLSEEMKDLLIQWIKSWYRCVSGIFLSSYFRTMDKSAIVPQNIEQRTLLLKAFLLEKAVYELGYELNSRPQWVTIPIKGINELLLSE
ncbi:MAG: maltose alpha-D-glucosyltransferase [Chitinivibrionales bacterium]|nr:maltose alpha-D-glucosyltransferase [Chitinivibrionales bacterium]